MSRSLGDVIDKILEIVPEEEFETRRILVWVRDNAAYSAPEMMRAEWDHVQMALAKACGNVSPAEGSWQARAIACFTGSEQKKEDTPMTIQEKKEALREKQGTIRKNIIHLHKDLDGTDYSRSGDRKELQFLVHDAEKELDRVENLLAVIDNVEAEADRKAIWAEMQPEPEDAEQKIVEAIDQISQQLTIMEAIIDHPKFEVVMDKIVGLSFKVMEKSGFMEKIFALAEKAPPQKIQIVNGVVEPAKVG